MKMKRLYLILTARISSKEDIDEVKIYLDGVEVEYIEG